MASESNIDTEETYRAPLGAPSGVEQFLYPTLTLLAHPDIDRVGERFVSKKTAGTVFSTPVARHEPEFKAPRTVLARSLGDQRISRTPPLNIHWQSDLSVELEVQSAESRVIVDGEPLSGRQSYDKARVSHGLVVELEDRIVLLVHRSQGRPPLSEHGMVGESDAIQTARRCVERYASERKPVLIRGETGVGKELVVQALHKASSRAPKVIRAINMGAIEPNTAYSRVFGHKRGAFTGSVGDHPGHVGLAEGGTLFLDEIAEAPADVQAMLLRFVQDGSYQRLGCGQVRQADVRIISATDAELETEMKDGHFKDPLYHRLSVCEFTIPPLRERRDDIGRLLAHFVRREMRERHQGRKLAYGGAEADAWLTPSLIGKLARYSWPGNIRQLEGVAMELVINSHDQPYAVPFPGGKTDKLLKRLEQQEALQPEQAPVATLSPPNHGERRPGSYGKDEVLDVLASCDREYTRAAKHMGMSRTTLYGRLKDFGVRLAKDFELSELEEVLAEHQGDEDAASAQVWIPTSAFRKRVSELRSRKIGES